MKMERDFESSLGMGMGMGECSFDHNLTPLPASDFSCPLHHHHNNQLPFSSYPSQFPSSSSFNDPTQLFDFFSKPQHHHLPVTSSSSSSFTPKRPRFDSHPPPLHFHHLSLPSPVLLNQSHRQAPQKLSDKFRSLQKLLPSDKKMDIATMLEEAHKYVRFLHAQVRAIESMPLESSYVVQNDCDWACFGGGSGLGILNRQQLLQVVVNSPGAQTMLYSQGFCVYSLEQLLLINKLSEPKLFMK